MNDPTFQLNGNKLDSSEIQSWLLSEEKYHDNLTQIVDDLSYSTDYWKYIWYLEALGLESLLKENLKILDFGCADGRTLLKFQGRYQYFGADLSEKLLEKARLNWPTGEFKKLTKHDSVPFADNQFDGVVCLGVLHHVPNVSEVMAELARVLKPGGWLVQLDPITDMTRLDGTRKNLSPKERGIPPVFFQQLKNEFTVEKTILGGLGGINQVQALLGNYWYQKIFFYLDRIICGFFDPLKINYSRRKIWQKFAPTFALQLFRKN